MGASRPGRKAGEMRAGAAAWVIESGDARIVVDPAFAADPILRNDDRRGRGSGGVRRVARRRGLPPRGLHARDRHALRRRRDVRRGATTTASWTKFFPNAPILMSQTRARRDGCRRRVRGAGHAAAARAGRVAGGQTATAYELTDEVSLEHTGGHSPGHQIVRVSSGGEQAVIVGHLAVSAVHVCDGRVSRGAHGPRRRERCARSSAGRRLPY